MRVRNYMTGEEYDIPTGEERASALLEELEWKAAERKKLGPTVIPKAKAYKKAINVAGIIACLNAILLLITVVVSVVNHGEVVMSLLLITFDLLMTLSMFVFSGLVLSRYLWERRLRKVGLFIPIRLK